MDNEENRYTTEIFGITNDDGAQPSDAGSENMIPFIIPNDTDDAIEEDDSFNLDRFQVVRREFFSHTYEPSITFNNYKVGLNAACIKKMPGIEYIQFLVNRQTKKLAIRPCRESDLHSFKWCIESDGKRKPRQVTGKIFFMKICDMMGWNPDYRYKILGKLIRANGEYLFAFDLSATEMYQRIFKEGAKPRNSRVPIFPAEWQDQFGVPYEEHRKSLQINIFDDYAIYGIRDKEVSTPADVKSSIQQTVPGHSGEVRDGGEHTWPNK